MTNNKNQAFVKGAAILLAANLLVKFIGAAFKIPLTYLLGETGMGLFNYAYQIYTWLFIIATAGFPVAISKMVSESHAQGNTREVKKIFKSSIIIMSVIGIAGFLVLFFGDDILAKLVSSSKGNSENLRIGIRALSPAILFVALMSVFRGIFQGHQDMLPTAMSEVAEALGKLILGYAFASMLIVHGIEYASAGAVFGVSVGAFLGFLLLAAVFLVKRRKIFDEKRGTDFGKVRSTGAVMKQLVKIAIPITIGASVFSLTSLIDMMMIQRRLMASGLDYEAALKLWGSYSGYAIPLFNMPSTLISAITVSLVPVIAGALAVNNRDLAKKTTGLSIRITILFALPCAVGMAVFAEPILHLVYKNTNASPMLSILGYAVVFVSLVMVTNAILQSIGKALIPVRNMIIGGVIKIVVNYILVGMPEIRINGAPTGTNLCYLVILVLNLISIVKNVGIKFSVVDFIIKPLISVAVMASVVLAVYANIGFIGADLATIVSILAGGAAYVILIFVVGAVKKEDLEMVPKAEKLIPIMEKLRLIRN